MRNSYGQFVLFAALVTSIGCAPVEPQAQMESAPAELVGSSSSRVTAHNVVFTVTPGSTLDEVDAELESGVDWFVLEEEGLIDIVEAWEDELVLTDGASGGPSSDRSYHTGITDVSPGKVWYVEVAVPSNFTYTATVTAYKYGTGALISDGYARADIWRVQGSVSEWRDYSLVKSGTMKVSTSCGSSCTGIRLKVENKASSNTHTYVYKIEQS